MSISRKNWSALSSLARQWTLEDEEEVERERRRKNRTHSEDPGDSSAEDVGLPPASAGSEDAGEAADPKAPADFAEMLRVREERRRGRHTLLRQQQEDEERKGPGQEENEGDHRAAQSPEPAVAPPTTSDITEMGSLSEKVTSESEPSQEKNTETRTKPQRTFVSSISISIDKSPTSPTQSSRMVSPMSPAPPTGVCRVVSPLSFTSSSDRNGAVSPLSPTRPLRSESPDGRAVSPAPAGSPAPRSSGAVVQNGESQDAQSASSAAEAITGGVQMEETVFQRDSPRALSFRMARRKEELSSPFQRSASVRVTSKASPGSKAPGQEDDSPFQRNSRQRTSSRSIQEKMERLALAVQKSENLKSPSVSQKGVYGRAEEVSRRRGLFERHPAPRDGGPRSFHQDLRNVDIAGKRNLWEIRSEEASQKKSSNKWKPLQND